MCLLHTHHADTKLSDAWIEDFWGYNSDGVGVMYSEADDEGRPQLVVMKGLPKSAAEAIAFYKEHIKGRECVVHWRMATHGDIDFDNCHPYEVLPMDSQHPMYMMHNGVLRCGNHRDRTKSDTWHYVQDYLKPLLDPEKGGNPDLAFKEPFIDILGDSIGGSNKFAFMDYAGNISIINRHDGVEWNGMWLSNTYAWSVPRHVTNTYNKYYHAGTGVVAASSVHDFDWMDEPEDAWTNYRYTQSAAVKPVGTAGSNAATVIPIGGTKLNKRQRKAAKRAAAKAQHGGSTVTVDHAGKVTGVKPAELMDAEALREEKEVDEIFQLLDSENLTKAYVGLSFQNFYRFIDHTDLDAAWEATYMLVDGVIDQTSYIDYILDPARWTDLRPRLDGRTNVSGGEVDPRRAYADEDGVLYDDDVIEATLPEPSPQTRDEIVREAAVAALTHVKKDNGPLDEVMPRTHASVPQIMPRPVIDQRANANIFDRAGGQGV